ncbi:hypothetical protein F5Y17DRAFT_453422 [Xylariaceae sp. FL0594]|nr:hypothetical protein F5Y17DRAFT_453422 [Xylariaceae sp. FL0594]
MADGDLRQGHYPTLTSLVEDTTGVNEMLWPLDKNLPTVFSHYIIKKNNKAAVRLLFPPNASKCCMYLEIATDQVQHMAKELFDVKIDTTGNQRFVSTKSGASIKIEGAIKLRRSYESQLRREVFWHLFDEYEAKQRFRAELTVKVSNFITRYEAMETWRIRLLMPIMRRLPVSLMSTLLAKHFGTGPLQLPRLNLTRA